MKWRWCLITFGLISAVGADLSTQSSNGPAFEGKTLHHWLSIYDAHARAAAGQNHNPAAAALQALCPDSVPLLLHWIERKGANPQTRQFAVHGFQFAGTNAAAAVPKLIALLGEKGSRSSSAANALGTLGAMVMPDLLKALESDNYLTRRNALVAVRMSDADKLSPQTLHAAVERMFDENEDVQFAAFQALETWKSKKEFFAPTLKQRLAQGALPPKCREIVVRFAPELLPTY